MEHSIAPLSFLKNPVTRQWMPAVALCVASLFLPPWLMITLLASIAPNLIAAAMLEEAPFQLPLAIAALLTGAMTILPSIAWNEVYGALGIQTFVFLIIEGEKLLYGGGRVIQALLGLALSLVGMALVRGIALA